MRWKWWRFRGKARRLDFSIGGRWFLVACLGLGIAAIYSGNNIIYLVESLLLSALLFSGVLSELTLKNLRVERIAAQAVAGRPSGDLILLSNEAWYPLYCVEVVEWDAAAETALSFTLVIPPKGQLALKSSQIFPRRGRHRWQGLALATSFPFGFARKMRFILEPGERLVWPLPVASLGIHGRGAESGGREWDTALGELEEIPEGADLSRVHWPSFSRSGKLLRRPLRPRGESVEVRLQLQPALPELERRIGEASYCLVNSGATLVLLSQGQKRFIAGASAGNDALASLPEEPA